MAESSGGDIDPTPGDLQYNSLYRRFRPQRFADVRGQEHVTRALLNTVREGRISHAYLFTGPRGTGKTSTARILAMALNCANPVDGEPDGTCSSCVDIRKGSSVDVQELDAASNRRIDEMRDLLSRVALGTRGRWKVYIIDEVHQLTADAASALLKTLEEPPAHVVFVLATTDPQKVLPTIRSRTIPFDFHLLPSEVLGDLLRDVNTRAGLGVAPEAIDLVVRRGHGSARDALTVLDQVAAGGGGEDPAQVVGQIVDGLAERDVGLVLTAVAEGMAAGRDARRLAADLLEHLRNGFLATMARGLVMLPDDAVAEVAEQARRLGLAALVRAMEVIGEALADMRDSVDPRVTLEVALVRLSRPDADVSLAALLERIERLERAARAPDKAGPAGERSVPSAPPQAAARSSLPPPPPTPVPHAGRTAPHAPPRTSAHPVTPPEGAGGSTPPPPMPTKSRSVQPVAQPPTPPTPPAPPAPPRGPAQPVAQPPAPPPPPRGPAQPVAQPPAPPSPPRGPAQPVAQPPAPPSPPRGPAQPVAQPPAPPSPPRGPAQPVAPNGSGEPGTLLGPETRAGAGASAPGPAIGSGEPVAPPSPPLFPDVPADAPSARTRTGPHPATAGAAPPAGIFPDAVLPTREELTKAWGDGVLRGLSGKAKAYLQSGRFVSVGAEGAVFALPNQQWLTRSLDARGEAEAALAARFGRPVPLKLIVEPVTAASAEGAPEPADEAEYVDLDHLTDAEVAVISPEQRLMDAFPGAEEVST